MNTCNRHHFVWFTDQTTHRVKNTYTGKIYSSISSFFVKSRLNWPVDTQLKFLAAFFSVQIVRTAARGMRNECEGDARGFN